MNLKVSDAKREEGFTLIELLVVVIIIGILAAIAIPVFLNQRERAWVRSAESDARNAAIEIETFFNDNFAYPAADITADGETSGAIITLDENGAVDADEDDYSIVVSPNVTLLYEPTEGAAGDPVVSYTITADHALVEESPVAVYNSAEGGLQQ